MNGEQFSRKPAARGGNQRPVGVTLGRPATKDARPGQLALAGPKPDVQLAVHIWLAREPILLFWLASLGSLAARSSQPAPAARLPVRTINGNSLGQGEAARVLTSQRPMSPQIQPAFTLKKV